GEGVLGMGSAGLSGSRSAPLGKKLGNDKMDSARRLGVCVEGRTASAREAGAEVVDRSTPDQVPVGLEAPQDVVLVPVAAVRVAHADERIARANRLHKRALAAVANNQACPLEGVDERGREME